MKHKDIIIDLIGILLLCIIAYVMASLSSISVHTALADGLAGEVSSQPASGCAQGRRLDSCETIGSRRACGYYTTA